jgi:hypothetical protein
VDGAALHRRPKPLVLRTPAMAEAFVNAVCHPQLAP